MRQRAEALLAWWRALETRTRPLQRVLGVLLPALALALWMAGVHATGRSPGGDGPHILGTGMRLAQMLTRFELLTLAECWNSLLAPHPPMAYLPATLAYALVGTTTSWAHLLGGAFVLGLIWDALRRLGAGPVGALWAAAAGGLWLQAEIYGVDFVASAAVLQSVSHLAASERLERRLNVVGWGAWMGVAFLCKYTAPFYLVAPCLLAGWWTLRHRRWRQLGWALLGFAVLALPWYVPHLDRIIRYAASSSDTSNPLLTSNQLITTWSVDRFTWYLGVLLDNFGRVGLLVALPALLWWRRRQGLKLESWSVPTLALLGGYLFLCLQTQRQGRYLTPALPLVAALVGSSRLRWLTAPVAAMGVYGVGAVYMTWSEVPTTRSFEHDLTTAGTTWPWPPEPFQPFSLSGDNTGLPQAVARLAEVHGRSDGTVGLMLAEERGAPGFGQALYEVNRTGARWHLSTPSMASPEAGYHMFVGPFAMEDWPDRGFDTALAIMPREDGRRERWLTGYGLDKAESWTISPALEGSIWVRSRPPDQGGALSPGRP